MFFSLTLLYTTATCLACPSYLTMFGMKTRGTLLFLFGVGLVVSLFAPIEAPAQANTGLVRADPAPGAVLDRAPLAVYAWFSQPLSAGSRLNIFDSEFRAVDQGQTIIDSRDQTLLHVDLNDLMPGRYTVNWQAIDPGGRQSTGSYDFVVRASSNLALVVLMGTVSAIGVVAIIVSFSRRSAFKRR